MWMLCWSRDALFDRERGNGGEKRNGKRSSRESCLLFFSQCGRFSFFSVSVTLVTFNSRTLPSRAVTGLGGFEGSLDFTVPGEVVLTVKYSINYRFWSRIIRLYVGAGCLSFSQSRSLSRDTVREMLLFVSTGAEFTWVGWFFGLPAAEQGSASGIQV